MPGTSPSPAAAARTRGGRRRASALAVALLAGTLAGCGSLGPGAAGGAVTPTAAATAEDQPGPGPAPEPTLVPGGSAVDNLPLFADVTARVWQSDERVSGRAYIDALIAAGFDKAAMQVTNDVSTVGNPAESIQFSVQWGGECLVGQVGPATGEPITVVVPALAEGGCLVGQTRTINW